MVVARREEVEQATKNKRENQDEDVSINLPRVKVGYGHVRHQENVRPCHFELSFIPIVQREVGDEAGNQGASDGGSGSCCSN
jgi:hypothetical protein